MEGQGAEGHKKNVRKKLLETRDEKGKKIHDKFIEFY